jgi:hypothetical protein
MIKEIKEEIISYLNENPSYNKGDLISHFNLPISDSLSDESRDLSYIIWEWNQKNGGGKNYSLTPSS